jgi:SET domain-containing protein
MGFFQFRAGMEGYHCVNFNNQMKYAKFASNQMHEIHTYNPSIIGV